MEYLILPSATPEPSDGGHCWIVCHGRCGIVMGSPTKTPRPTATPSPTPSPTPNTSPTPHRCWLKWLF